MAEGSSICDSFISSGQLGLSGIVPNLALGHFYFEFAECEWTAEEVRGKAPHILYVFCGPLCYACMSILKI